MLQDGLVSYICIVIEKKPQGQPLCSSFEVFGKAKQQGGYRRDMVKFCIVQDIAQPTRLFSFFPWPSGSPTLLSSGETFSVNRFGNFTHHSGTTC